MLFIMNEICNSYLVIVAGGAGFLFRGLIEGRAVW